MSFTTDVTVYVNIPDDHPARTALAQPFPFRPASWLTEIDRRHLQAGGHARWSRSSRATAERALLAERAGQVSL